ADERLRGETTAIERVERGLADLGKDPDLACFLAAGASVASERFRTACRALAAVLDVPLAPPAALPFSRLSLAQELARHEGEFTVTVQGQGKPDHLDPLRSRDRC
ncbi:MAG: hypothetical protein ACREFZ_06705, partial [Acetobacteraceae bacterium]